MKNKFNFWLLFAALLCSFALTSCSDPDDEEDDIYVNINGGSDSNGGGNGGDAEQNAVSIVGTWKTDLHIEGESYSTYYIFNADKTGVYKCPGWEYNPDTDTSVRITRTFNLTYEYNAATCAINIRSQTEEGVDRYTWPAYIIDNTLHIYDILVGQDLVFTRVE